MLDILKKTLDSHPDITRWSIQEIRKHGNQLYTGFGEIESVRSVSSLTYRVEIFTPAACSPGNGGECFGSTTLEFFPGETDVKQKLDEAVAQAGVHGNRAYELPDAGLEYSEFNNADPAIRDRPRETITELVDRMNALESSEENIRVSSSEFFLNYLDYRLVNNRGLDQRMESTSVLWDICLLFQDGLVDKEFWEIYKRPGLNNLPLETDFRRFAQHARDAARTETPRSGECPVVLTGDSLYILLLYYMYHSSASAKYNGSALFKPGESVLTEDAKGDALTIYSNAVHPAGTRSFQFDSQGLPGARTRVIHDGRLERYWASNQYAQYLDIAPTGEFGNFEIPPGNTPWADLFKSTDRVILVVQFSTFDPQPVAGNYLGEIRVGYEYRADGTVVPLRGGSVTGNVADGMLDCRFSREIETFDGYYGPRGIRFERAQIAGK